MAQLNFKVGDVAANVAKIKAAICEARDSQGAHLVVFPELSVTGYPPEDLLLRPGFHAQVLTALAEVVAASVGIDVIVGHPRRCDGHLYNAASWIRDQQVIAVYDKQKLPNYGVFDEQRYFSAGTKACVGEIQEVPVGITICEDIWYPEPAQRAVKAGARLIVNLNASPFHLGKLAEREAVVAARARENNVPIVYANLVGGQDELVFDGASFVLEKDGQPVYRMASFVEAISVADFTYNGETVKATPGAVFDHLEQDESAYDALVLGVRDYVRKNGFRGAVLGMSGGIDSALTLAIAVDALGSENVEAIMMPYRYTAAISLEDAQACATALKVKYSVISIERSVTAFQETLKDAFAGAPTDVTEENIQARCRGLILMAISNKQGKMVLTTGNKSEMAVGYATLYGDMAGGFDVLKDVPKTLVFRLSEFRNRRQHVIPQRIIDRPPSAELRPDQTDQDSLPPYDILDAILERYVERDMSTKDIVAEGFDRETVIRVAKMVDRNEYKRRQAAPGVRITPRAFGKDRRYPITSGYTEPIEIRSN